MIQQRGRQIRAVESCALAALFLEASVPRPETALLVARRWRARPVELVVLGDRIGGVHGTRRGPAVEQCAGALDLCAPEVERLRLIEQRQGPAALSPALRHPVRKRTDLRGIPGLLTL